MTATNPARDHHDHHDHHDHAKCRTTSGDLLMARPEEAHTPSVARNILLPGSTQDEHSLTGRSENLSGLS
jgi:hypothetical protein